MMPKVDGRWLVLAAMAGSASMIMLDQTVVTVALPAVSRELPLTPTGQQWVVNANVLAMAALVALGGRLGDRLGGVTTFRVGVTTFFLASLACALAPHGAWGESWIIMSRAVQGAGAALMMPVSAAMVANAFSTADRGRAMAVYGGISQVFLALGPLTGGLLTQTVSWRAVFWLNVPLGLIALATVHLAKPDNTRSVTRRVPLGATLLLVGGVGLVVLALQEAGRWGAGSPATVVTLAAGIVLSARFVRTQACSTAPLVNVRLLARRAVLGNVVVLGLFQFGLLAVMLFASLYMQDLLGLDPLLAGIGVLPLVLPLMAAAQLSGLWYDRSGVRGPVLIGLAIAACGLAAWAAALPELTYELLTPGMAITGLGLGLAASPCFTDALGRVSPTERGQASGLIQTIRQLGGAFGVAIIGAVVLSVEHDGSRAADPAHGAFAITLGFCLGAVVFAIALGAGTALLPRTRVDDSVDVTDGRSTRNGDTGGAGHADDRPIRHER